MRHTGHLKVTERNHSFSMGLILGHLVTPHLQSTLQLSADIHEGPQRALYHHFFPPKGAVTFMTHVEKLSLVTMK